MRWDEFIVKHGANNKHNGQWIRVTVWGKCSDWWCHVEYNWIYGGMKHMGTAQWMKKGGPSFRRVTSWPHFFNARLILFDDVANECAELCWHRENTHFGCGLWSCEKHGKHERNDNYVPSMNSNKHENITAVIPHYAIDIKYTKHDKHVQPMMMSCIHSLAIHCNLYISQQDNERVRERILVVKF